MILPAKPSLHQVTQRLLEIYQPVAVKQNSFLVNEVPQGLKIEADAVVVFRLLGSILYNASRLGSNTCIKISAKAYHDIILMHIKDTSTFNSYAIASAMEHLQLPAAKIGGYIEVTSLRKKETTIAFSFMNRPGHYHITGGDQQNSKNNETKFGSRRA